jgi:hypothetical protein
VIHPTTTLKENPMAETATAEHPLVAQQHQPHEVATMPGFTSNANWELAQRIGKAFASSDLVPQQYRGNLANCIVALEMANRMGASPLMVMQNLYIVHGNPGWSSKFLVACFNQCGRFSALRYQWNDARSECRAWAVEKATGERIEGPTVSIEMARAEGWSTKAGSKWKTMPELMLMYRAAAFLIRTYAPEISMGLRTDDEIVDMGPADMVSGAAPRHASPAEVTALLSKPAPAPAPAAAAAARDVHYFIEQVDNALDAEQAMRVIDGARDVLSATDNGLLWDTFERAWKA